MAQTDKLSVTENIRLDVQSEGIISTVHGKPFYARLSPPPKRILDVGCGTGVMTVMLARLFPDAEVYGLDLADVPPTHDKPENVTYIKGSAHDLLGPSTTHPDIFVPGSFDYVYSRAIVFGMTDCPTWMRKGLQHPSTRRSIRSPGVRTEVVQPPRLNHLGRLVAYQSHECEARVRRA
jgi:SAM-dependent methyltransferase